MSLITHEGYISLKRDSFVVSEIRIVYMDYGLLHRETGPAIYDLEEISWCQNDRLHRECHPALISNDILRYAYILRLPRPKAS